MLAGAGFQQRGAELQVGQRCGATLANQIEGLHIAAQTEPLDHMTRQARTQITGTGADHHSVDLVRSDPGLGYGTFGRLGREHGRVREKTSGKGVGVYAEHLGQRINGESARLNAVIALQHSACDQVRAGIQSRIPVRMFERLQAFGFGVACCGSGGSDSEKKHGWGVPC